MIRCLTVATAMTLTVTAAQACHTDRFNFIFGADAGSHMDVRSGESCKFGLKISPRSHLASVALAQAPQHGAVTQVDQTHWTYKPVPGFRGSDAVAIRLSGDYMGNRGMRVRSGDSNITWGIDVEP